MNGIFAIYRKAVNRHFNGQFIPNWPLPTEQRIGDYGTIRNGIFERVGHLNDLGVPTKELKSRSTSHQQFTSSTSVSVELKGKSAVLPNSPASLNAHLAIGFSKGHGAFYNAAGVRTSRLANHEQVGNKLLELTEQGKWNTNFFVVTILCYAARSIVAISSESEAKIELEAASDSLEQIQLADAKLSLRVKNSSNIGFFSGTDNGAMALLLGLSMLQRRFRYIGKQRFDPAYQYAYRIFESRNSHHTPPSYDSYIHVPDQATVEELSPMFNQIRFDVPH